MGRKRSLKFFWYFLFTKSTMAGCPTTNASCPTISTSCPKSINATKLRVQGVVLVVGVVLLVGKFAAYFLTGSVGVLTDAMESIVNVVAGGLGLWSVWLASRPRDSNHPYGHGKVELLTASVEGILIIVAGLVIIYEGFGRIFSDQMPGRLDIGIVIVAVAGAVNWVLGAWSVRMGKRASSMALIAGGRHLQSDTYSTIGLVAGLVLLYVLELPWIDGALALLFGGVIMVTGVRILRRTASNLMDTVDDGAIAKMARAINDSRHSDWVDVHDLRAINYGEMLHIDCHLTLPRYYSIELGHQMGDDLEDVLRTAVAPHTTLISVHSDACDERMCNGCAMKECPIRAHEFEQLRELTIVAVTENDDQRAARLDR